MKSNSAYTEYKKDFEFPYGILTVLGIVDGSDIEIKLLSVSDSHLPLSCCIRSNGEWEVNSSDQNGRTSSNGFSAKRFGFKKGETFSISIHITLDNILVYLNEKQIATSEYQFDTNQIKHLLIRTNCLLYRVFHNKEEIDKNFKVVEYLNDKIRTGEIEPVKFEQNDNNLQISECIVDEDRRLIIFSSSDGQEEKLTIHPQTALEQQTLSQRYDELTMDSPEIFSPKTKSKLNLAKQCADLLSNNMILPEDYNIYRDLSMDSQLHSISPEELSSQQATMDDHTEIDEMSITSSNSYMPFHLNKKESYSDDYDSDDLESKHHELGREDTLVIDESVTNSSPTESMKSIGSQEKKKSSVKRNIIKSFKNLLDR